MQSPPAIESLLSSRCIRISKALLCRGLHEIVSTKRYGHLSCQGCFVQMAHDTTELTRKCSLAVSDLNRAVRI